MQTLFFNIFFCSILCAQSQNFEIKKSFKQPISFNANTSSAFTPHEFKMLEEVYGSFLKSEILDRPTRVLAMKEIFRNRVVVREISNPESQKPCPFLSQVPIFDSFVSGLTREVTFKVSTFNPVKYDFEFHSDKNQIFRVDNTDYFIIIKPQHYNN